MQLDLTDIRTDGGTQPRAQLDGVTVSEYAEAMERGADFPPVKVMHDGENYWLYDGFHRLKAAQQIERTTIEADVEQGTKKDAQWASLAANKDHGLRRNQKDRRRAIKRALKGWGNEKPQVEIAEHIGVSNSTVSRISEEVFDSKTSSQNSQRGRGGRVQGKDGKWYPATKNKSSSDDSSSGSSDGDTSDTPTAPQPSTSDEDDSTEPMTTGSPDRRRRRKLRTRDTDFEPIKSEQDEDEDLPSTEDITRRVVKKIAVVRDSDGAQMLLDFADEQHQFTEDQKQEVKDTAERLITFLQQAKDSIKT